MSWMTLNPSTAQPRAWSIIRYQGSTALGVRREEANMADSIQVRLDRSVLKDTTAMAKELWTLPWIIIRDCQTSQSRTLEKGHHQGNIDEHHNTFNMHVSPKSPTDQKFVALSEEERALHTPHQNASNLIRLQPVPVKRLCSKRNSMHHQSAATLPGCDQITLDPANPQQDSVHCEDQCGLPLPPMQFQDNRDDPPETCQALQRWSECQQA